MIKSNLNLNLPSFVFPPQYPIDTQRMYRTEMDEKTSFLIKGNLAGLTPSLLRGTSTDMGVEITLDPGISLNKFGDNKIYPFDVTTAVVAKTGTSDPYKYGDDWRIYYGKGSVWLKVSPYNIPRTGDCPSSRWDSVNGARNRVLAKFVTLFTFLLAYCKAVSGKTAESICKFFGHSPFPRGENVSAPLYYEATFPDAQQASLAAAEEKLLAAFSQIDKPADIPNSPITFSFPDKWGDACCKVAVVYNHENRTKTLCPMTPFLQHGSCDAEMFRFLGTKTIPWSQHDFQDREVVITDNVEFAFWNRERFLEAGKLLITFPEAYGRYDLLDLEALNSADKVFMLVANFADETMAEACASRLSLAESINAAMDDKSKFSVFLMSLAFEPIPGNIRTTVALAAFIKEHRPRILEACIATDFDDFKALCGTFEAKVMRKKEADKALRTLMDEPAEEKALCLVAPNKTAQAQADWLVRSAIDKGGHIELIAQEKTGKTNFAVTLAYAIVTANQQKAEGLIPGRFWTVSKAAAKKAVYLDSELGTARFNVIRDRVKGAYLPKKSKEAAELDANFIYHDLFAQGGPYAKRENHQYVLDLLAADEQVGTPGPVGLVIIDTRRGFTNNQVGLEPQLIELIVKIRQRGCEVLVLHHMDEKNNAAGNYSVTTGKTGMIKMFRDYVSQEESREKCDLTYPVKFQLSTYGAFQPAFDADPFYAKCEDGRWTLVEMVGDPDGLNTQFQPVAFDEKAILKGLVEEYKRGTKASKAKVAEYLGITDDTLASRMK